MPRSELRKQRTRATLLGAARTLFAERGFEATTIAAIGERAELGFGTFYLHFRDKDDVLRAVVEEGLAELRDQIDASSGLIAPGGQALRVILRFAFAHRDLFRIILTTRTANAALDAQSMFRDRLADALAGLMPVTDAALTARFVAGVMNQAVFWWFDHDDPVDGWPIAPSAIPVRRAGGPPAQPPQSG
ncbi:MAG: TetR/AcrR family transcriptional regulator [Dehalococcoidia bacterium]